MSANKHIILFDGICNLCNYWVRFAIKHNAKKNLYFAPLQSQFAKNLLTTMGFTHSNLTSVVFYKKDKIYTQSSAAFTICLELNGLWKLLFLFIVVPKFIRDFIYNIIAKNRYKWFGKKEQCMVPSPELKDRFLD
jgi:predicted DCC family thiol-disulfide oxidoreductase YuxK